MSNDDKIVGAKDAFKEAEKQVDEIDKQFEPKDPTIFDQVSKAIDKLEKDGKI